jgi:predicted phage tail component-like protein
MRQLIESYAGKPVPASLIIEQVTPDVMASIINTSQDIPMGDGAIHINKRLGTKAFKVDLSVIASDKTQVLREQAVLAEWLNYDEPQPLILGDMPEVTYYCLGDGQISLDKKENIASGTITFVCFEGNGYGQTKSYVMQGDTTQVQNGGNKEAYPIINMTLAKDTTDFFVTGSEQTVYIGEPFDPTEKTVQDTRPLLFNDPCNSTTNWAQATTFIVDGGQVKNTLSSNGYSFGQAAKDYGTASGLWHGGAMVRSLGKEVQDFDLEAQIGLLSTDVKQKGRIEVYLLDINDKRIAKISLKDIDSGRDNPMFDAWLGQINNGGVQTVNSYGSYRGVWKQFNGVINIGRRGKQWHFYIAQVDTNTYQHHTRYYKTVTDTWGKYGDKVAKVLIHIAAYGNDAPVDEMWVSNVRVNELLDKQDGKVDYVGKAGDTITIDCEKGEILRNGQFLTQQYPATEFIKLKKGANGITLSDPTLLEEGTIEFTERWL